MPKKPAMTQKEFKSLWKTLPEADRRFFRTMIVIQDAMGLKDLHYRLLPPELEKRLIGYDCHMLFSILADCVGLLTSAPAMTYVKEFHRGQTVAESGPVDASGRRRGIRLPTRTAVGSAPAGVSPRREPG
jgi:hypothetical protein